MALYDVTITEVEVAEYGKGPNYWGIHIWDVDNERKLVIDEGWRDSGQALGSARAFVVPLLEFCGHTVRVFGGDE